MSDKLAEFREYRERMNKKILESDNLDIKRFFALDGSVYCEGALDARTKELLGLAASAVLRCNDCILYHLIRSVEEKATDAQIRETLAVALIVGGSITIPHLRYAFEMMEKIRAKADRDGLD